MKDNGIKIAITGASGFIGRHALHELQPLGHEIHTIGRSPSAPAAGVVHHQFDLLTDGELRGLLQSIRPTHLLHLSWSATPGAFWHTLDNLDWVGATLRLARAFAEVGGRRMTVAGTCAEYDWKQPPFEWHGSPLREGCTPLAPLTLYGAAKNCTRALLEAAAPGLEISLAWGRVFFTYGPGEATGRLVPDVITALLQGRAIDCSEGLQKRDYLHVSDVAHAFATLLLSDVTGPVNIAAGVSLSIRDLVGRISNLIGRPELVRFGGKTTNANEPPEIVADVTRLTSEVQFTPRIGIAQGLQETVDWWRYSDEGAAMSVVG